MLPSEGPKADQTTTTVGVEKRAQPWKANWPPKEVVSEGVAYGFPKGNAVVIFGN